MDPASFDWHTATAAACAERLATDPKHGLDAAEAARRLQVHGPNEIRETGRRGPAAILLAQFTDFIMLVLAGAAVVSGLVGDLADTVVILAIIVLNGVIGFVQEYRAERAIAALRSLGATTARVWRDGSLAALPAARLVPGDVVTLEAGDVVPADLRLLEAPQLRTDESSLTGESQPVDKSAVAQPPASAMIGDRLNMAFKGTLAVHGRALGLVVATGMDTELGRIAALLSADVDSRTPLQRRLARFGQQLSLGVLAICAIVFFAGVQRGEPLVLMFMTAVSLAVAAIPSALPAVVTITLALGAHRMSRVSALVRHLPSVETLGSVSFVCSDKTGTLTLNQMSAERFHAGESTLEAFDARAPGVWHDLAVAMVLNNDARPGDGGHLFGDPTETALYRAAVAAGIEAERCRAAHPRVAELPFEARRKRMLTAHRAEDGGYRILVKGAPEEVLSRCHAPESAWRGAEALAASGLRVLAFAQRRTEHLPADLEALEGDLEFSGLVGLLDPPRPEAAAAVAEARSAGITPVMITGDHAVTARAIARRLGILDETETVTEGEELGRLSPTALALRLRSCRVYARVSPEQKLLIVRALQDQGEVVAVTGDGVNDAPALKRGDIGVAMGRIGTDVAREAADLVLLDDNFATIVRAVREGRRIYDNIRRFVRYGLTTNSGEVWTLFLAPFLGLPLPLLPIQILWINLVTDGLPGLALAAEPAERGVMRRAPRPMRESLFAHGLGTHVIWVGLLMGGLAIGAQAWAVQAGNPHWQTLVFTALTLMQMAHVLAIRSERESLFTQDPRANPALPVAVALTLALQLAVVYVPALQPIFKTQPLTAGELGLCFALAALIFLAVEAEKALIRRGLLYADALGPPAAPIRMPMP